MEKYKSIHDEFQEVLTVIGRDIRELHVDQQTHLQLIKTILNSVKRVLNMTFAALVLCAITTLIYLAVLVSYKV